MARVFTIAESRESQPSSAECEADIASQSALAAALERLGCQVEMPASSRDGGEEPLLPAVTFRAPGTLLSEILELIAELANRPPSRARLSQVWSVESRPSLQGGLLHTLAPRRESYRARPCEVDAPSARRDSETLAAFFLLRRGQTVEASPRVPGRRSMRMPATRPTEARSRGYYRGVIASIPPVPVGRR